MKIKNVPTPAGRKEVAVKLRVSTKKKVLVHTVSHDNVITAFEYKQHVVEVVRGDTLAALKKMEKLIVKTK